MAGLRPQALARRDLAHYKVKVRRLPIALLFAVLALATTGGATAGASTGVEGVEWGGTHFTSKQQLSTWLAAHGIRYADWARRHPLGRYLMTHPPASPLQPVPAPPTGTTALGPVVRPDAGRPALAAAAFLAVAALLLGIAVAGHRLARLAPARFDPDQIPVARAAAAAGSAALLTGAALVWWS